MSVARPARVFVVRVAYTKVFLSGLLEGLTFEETEGASGLHCFNAEASNPGMPPVLPERWPRVLEVAAGFGNGQPMDARALLGAGGDQGAEYLQRGGCVVLTVFND